MPDSPIRLVLVDSSTEPFPKNLGRTLQWGCVIQKRNNALVNIYNLQLRSTSPNVYLDHSITGVRWHRARNLANQMQVYLWHQQINLFLCYNIHKTHHDV